MIPQLSIQERDRRYRLVRGEMAKRDIDCLLLPANTGRWEQLQGDSRYLSTIGGFATEVFTVFPREGGVTAYIFNRAAWWKQAQNWVEDVRDGRNRWGQNAIERINELKDGDALYPMLDVLNPFDGDAVGLRTNDPVWLIGYVPRFFAKDTRMCIQATEPSQVRLQVMRLNLDAPLQLRLLCRLTAPWPKGFEACSGPEFEPLVKTDAETGQFQEATEATVG